MAKKRPFRRYLRGNINHELELSTLAARTLISSNIGDNVTERAYCSSVKAAWSLGDFTPGADRGPILVGLAHSDYTSAQIEEWVENQGSWQEADKIQQEQARRLIRRVGIIVPADDASESAMMADGRLVHTKCGWILTQGQTLKVWAYNLGDQALATTSPKVVAEGHANLWPK